MTPDQFPHRLLSLLGVIAVSSLWLGLACGSEEAFVGVSLEVRPETVFVHDTTFLPDTTTCECDDYDDAPPGRDPPHRQ